jgi:hypothetical protein
MDSQLPEYTRARCAARAVRLLNLNLNLGNRILEQCSMLRGLSPWYAKEYTICFASRAFQ